MKRNFVLLAVLLVCFVAASCKKDEETARLRDEVKRLSSDNQELKTRVEMLEQQLAEAGRASSQTSSDQEPQSAVQTAAAAPQLPPMTLDQARAELQPLLADTVLKLKQEKDTVWKSGQFGMRTDYAIKTAFYGLIRGNDPETPYTAKVLVPFERFLVTQSGSKSYGKGVSRFQFGYRNGKWVLLSRD